MSRFWRLMISFVKRDLYTEMSYRIAFVMSFTSIILGTFSFYFISFLVSENDTPGLAEYGNSYFAFALIGMALNAYFTLGLDSFALALRDSQTTGTLEAMIMTPTPLSQMVIGSALWSYVYTTVRVLILCVLGFFLGVRLPKAQWLPALAVVAVAILVFASVGILSASVIMVIKRGNPVTLLVGSVGTLLSGVFYPVEILPTWLQPFSALFPLKYGLDGVRKTLLLGAGWDEITTELIALTLFFVVLFPLSLYSFQRAVRLARIDGSLAHY